MQIVFLRAGIVDNLVHPISSTQAYSQTIQAAMVLQPCANRSLPSPYLEMAEALVPMDEPDQIKYLKLPMSVNDIPAMNPMPVPLIPLHFLSKNAGVYENEDKHGLLPQLVSDYADLFLS